jgi:hypothetical protein
MPFVVSMRTHQDLLAVLRTFVYKGCMFFSSAMASLVSDKDDVARWRALLERALTDAEKDELSEPDFANMTPLQADVLAAFRFAMQESFDKNPADVNFRSTYRIWRFIRGLALTPKGSFQLALKHMRDACAFRKERNAATISAELMETEMKLEDTPYHDLVCSVYPTLFLSSHLDKEGHPIVINQLGMSDPTNLVEGKLTDDQAIEYFVRMAEMRFLKVDAMSEERQRLVRALIIQDLHGLSMKHIASGPRRFIKMFINIMSNNFPEIMYKICVINAPWAFTAAWALVKPLLPERTVKKVVICGADYKSELLKLIDVENLLVSYGGTLDIALPAMVKEGSDVETCFVPRGDSVTIEVPIATEHRRFCLEYQCESGDATVEVSCGGSIMNTITRKERGKCSILIPGTADATVAVKFDNTFSWVHGKTILYKYHASVE